MKTYFEEMVRAIRDFKFYKTVKDFQTIKAIKYIFFMISLITLVLTLRYTFDLNRGLRIFAEWAKQNLPVIEIENGIVSADVVQPYKIEEEDFTFIIDTTGTVTSLDDYDRGILVMKNKVVYKESDVKTESYDLSGIEAIRIDEDFMVMLRRNVTWILFPIMLLVIFVFFTVAKFLQVFVFTLVSLATCSIVNVKLDYKAIFNIGIYALTPSALLGFLLAFFNVRLPLFGIIYSGLYVIYLIMAILNCKDTPSPVEAGAGEMPQQ